LLRGAHCRPFQVSVRAAARRSARVNRVSEPTCSHSVSFRQKALAVLRRVLDDGDALFAERDGARLLLHRLGG
jgi:hypothetical protein